MGTDIHAVFQRKQPDGSWQDIPCEWKQDRHYALFAWLVDVRNGFGVAEQRGLPEDFKVEDEYHPTNIEPCPKPYRFEDGTYWMGDRSHSWLTLDEILTAKLPGHEFDYFIEAVRKLDGLGEVRVVFGFDS